MPVKYDKHYAESPRACGAPFAPFIEIAEQLAVPARVLDLGCGQGRDALVFARRGHEVVGVDVSSVGIQQLARIARAEGLAVTAHVADVVDYVPEGTFSAVLLDRVLHMLPTDDARHIVLTRACSAVRPGGHLLVSDYPAHIPLIRDAITAREGWELSRDERGFLFARSPLRPRRDSSLS